MDQGNAIAKQHYGSNLGWCHSDHEFKARPLCMVVAEQLESWVFQGWGLGMQID